MLGKDEQMIQEKKLFKNFAQRPSKLKKRLLPGSYETYCSRPKQQQYTQHRYLHWINDLARIDEKHGPTRRTEYLQNLTNCQLPDNIYTAGVGMNACYDDLGMSTPAAGFVRPVMFWWWTSVCDAGPPPPTERIALLGCSQTWQRSRKSLRTLRGNGTVCSVG